MTNELVSPIAKSGHDRKTLLRQLIEANNFTQPEAAEYIGVQKAAVEHWLQGRRSVPKYAILPLQRRLDGDSVTHSS